ncbi:MAG: sensor histidine kinase [Winogradskyella sp.]|uniref:sensor histidine kinase n=1 Tax=Winogradskyella sp. TaxID=1883156 RepID=UPI0025EF18C0|nr:sensor histidine kinase [Winogradskyella sp.]NRB60367.1 sensor histidine kinase [Winogradskyella sp.]
MIKLAEDWFHFNTIENNALKQKNLKIETELKALRSQINPHFLFNSLNVIYALALEKKEGTVEAIVQLSDILRYVIYDANTERVSLKEELDLLKNYIAFQSHRTKTAVTTLNIEIEDDTFKIYPMLLLPLIENSYKHSIYDDEASHAITIKIWQSGLDFNFSITNAKSETKNQHNKDRSGVGIQNIKTNLDLVYPGRYDFEINETSKIFQVNLALKNEN